MKPFPGKDLSDEKLVYNYRLSRARRTSENAFGILAGRFQIFKKPINTSPENIKDIVLATVVLHYYLQGNASECAEKGNSEVHNRHSEAQGGLEPLQAIGRGHGHDAKVVRETLVAYLINEGRVPW